MILKSGRQLTTIDIFSAMALLSLIALSVGLILQREFDLKKCERARGQVESTMAQLEALHKQNLTSRTPSSETLNALQFSSIDPWGQPLVIQFIKNSYGQPVRALVWSKGPNQQDDSLDQINLRPSGDATSLFHEDDIGAVTSL